MPKAHYPYYPYSESLAQQFDETVRELGITCLRRVAAGVRLPSYVYECNNVFFEFFREVSGDYFMVGRKGWFEPNVPGDYTPYVFGLATMDELFRLLPRRDIREPSDVRPSLKFLQSNWGISELTEAASGVSQELADERRREFWQFKHDRIRRARPTP